MAHNQKNVFPLYVLIKMAPFGSVHLESFWTFILLVHAGAKAESVVKYMAHILLIAEIWSS